MPDEENVTLPYLRLWRKYCLFTQQELAEKSHVSKGAIIAAEKGAPISLSTVEGIANALGIDTRSLMRRIPEHNEGERHAILHRQGRE
jgi:transcriptional regulator with XRE-family HTH domain